jgi:hypothetical protein
VRTFDAAAVLDRAALLHCALDQLAHERGRLRREPRTLRFDGADNRGLERRLLLFEIERDLLVRDAAQQRLDEEHVRDEPHDEGHDDPEEEDRFRRETVPL